MSTNVKMSEGQELKIYKNYRATMKKRNSVGGGYPSYWRQLARKNCVERYNVSYKEVKRIVAKYDAVYEITHEKQEAEHNPFNKPQDHVPNIEEFFELTESGWVPKHS